MAETGASAAETEVGPVKRACGRHTPDTAPAATTRTCPGGRLALCPQPWVGVDGEAESGREGPLGESPSVGFRPPPRLPSVLLAATRTPSDPPACPALSSCPSHRCPAALLPLSLLCLASSCASAPLAARMSHRFPPPFSAPRSSPVRPAQELRHPSGFPPAHSSTPAPAPP